MEKEIIEKKWTENDEVNGTISYRSSRCPFCKEEETFMNVGTSQEEWIGMNCHLKTSFGKSKMVRDRFGIHFE